MNKEERLKLCKMIKTDIDSYDGIRKQLDKIEGSLSKRETHEIELLETIDELKKQLQEKTTNDRVRELEEQLRKLRAGSLGVLNEVEREGKRAAYETHYQTGCSCNPMLQLHYTGLGTAYVVKCEKCGYGENITDYSSW